jgi:hypothetical protein
MIDRVVVPIQPYMISGIGEQAKPIYKRCLAKDGRRWWVAANMPNAADFVYADGGPGSQGFGGATLKFPLEDGTIDESIGPWHASASGLFEETGYDVRNRTKNWCVIGEEFEYRPLGQVFGGGANGGVVAVLRVHHVDPDGGILHEPYREDIIGHLLANKLRKKLCVIGQSSGGGHITTIEPDQKPWGAALEAIARHPDLEYWLTSPVSA